MAVMIDVFGFCDSAGKAIPLCIILMAPLSGFIFPTEIT